MNKLLVKLIINGVITASLLVWLSNATWLESILASVGLSLIAWLIGDQMILRATNNAVATVADFGLAYVYLWGAAVLLRWTLTFGEIALISAAIAVAELVYHRYLGVEDATADSQ